MSMLKNIFSSLQRPWNCLHAAKGRQTASRSHLHIESLEPRQMLTADCGLICFDQATSDVEAPHISALVSSPEFPVVEASEANASPAISAILSLPYDLPDTFSTSVEIAGETLTLQLDKNSIFGENTRFLVSDGSGGLVQIDPGPDRSYLGTVAEHPNFGVSALLTEEGLMANIIRPELPSITVEPMTGSTISGMHKVFVAEAGSEHDPAAGREGEEEPAEAALAAPLATSEWGSATVPPLGPEEGPGGGAAATLPPTRVMDVLEYEVGVEIGSNALLNNYSGSTVQQKVASALAEAAKIPGNLDARYLHSAGIKHILGTVIIRTSAAEDPFTVSNGNDSAGLSAFRSYWNNLQANEGIAPTHDLAVYHVRASPSGLAYVNSVGTGSRYALTASNGPSSWADGTLAHEFGHSWSLPHVGDGMSQGLFYEARPRDNSGADFAGGNNFYISPMDGSGQHNIGRLATDEANRVYNVREGKRQFGELVINPAQVKPFGQRDQAGLPEDGSPVVIDVIANDFDINNDVLDVQLLDTVSFLGGTISLSSGTGPGGRNEVIYTPPANFGGEDFFHYTVVDSTGRKDFGAVYITSARLTVDTSQNFFAYDLGTPTSPVFSNETVQAVRVMHETFGDVSWSGGVLSEDRPNSGQNAYNRDFVRGFSDTTWSHKLSPGTWNVTLNMSDPAFSFDNMFVDAEGVRKLSNIDRPAGQNGTMNFEVFVDDGFLDLTFGDDDANDPRWAVNRIVLERVGDPPVFVDLDAESYAYDFGTSDSPVFNQGGVQAVRIAPGTFGDVNWSGTVSADDRPSSGQNAYNRDLVWATSPVTWSHNIANGTWRVTVNMSDPDRDVDNMYVQGEGLSGLSDLDRPIGLNTTVSFEVLVTDGVLDLTFGDDDVVSPIWALNRVVLLKVGDAETVVDTSLTEYDYDFGQASSPTESGFQSISPDTYGDINWSNPVSAIDRVGAPTNAINRDFVTSSTSSTLNHKIANGVWRVTVNMGDDQVARDLMSIRAEGQLISDAITSPAGQYSYVDSAGASTSPVTFRAVVLDGELNLELSDNGGADNSWVLNRLSLELIDPIAPPSLPGDFNEDMVVNSQDYAIWREQLGNEVTPYSLADASGNGVVDTADIDLWRDNYGKSFIPVALINSTLGNGSFEDWDDAGAGARILVNGSTGEIPGWTVLTVGNGGWLRTNDPAAIAEAASDGVAFAIATGGSTTTLTSDSIAHNTVEGNEFTIRLDASSKDGSANKYDLFLVFGGQERLVSSFIESANATTSSPVTHEITYVATAGDAGMQPVLKIVATTLASFSQTFLDNVELDVRESALGAGAGASAGVGGMTVVVEEAKAEALATRYAAPVYTPAPNAMPSAPAPAPVAWLAAFEDFANPATDSPVVRADNKQSVGDDLLLLLASDAVDQQSTGDSLIEPKTFNDTEDEQGTETSDYFLRIVDEQELGLV